MGWNISYKTHDRYASGFAGVEDPISEGGKWANGLAVGLEWNNLKTNGSGVFPAAIGVLNAYDDPIAHLSTSYFQYAANQFAQATIVKQAGFTLGFEVELLLRFQITAHDARGYELYWSNYDGSLAISRWNGPRTDYTSLGSTAPGYPANGDVIRFEVVGSTLTGYVNGTQQLQVTDPTFSLGQPGIGFAPWELTNSADLVKMGFSVWTAGNL